MILPTNYHILVNLPQFQVPKREQPILVFIDHPINGQGTSQVHADGVVVGSESGVVESFAALISAYFVFRVKYPKFGEHFLTLLQIQCFSDLSRGSLVDRPVKMTMKSTRLWNKLGIL